MTTIEHAPAVARITAIGQAAHNLRLAANRYALDTTPANEQALQAAIRRMHEVRNGS